ncbi:CRISPR-associated exonuclease, Cas4 family [Ktedonobacter racemifer DSM 44963]|uniref:CRISPR-associated exonuclease, Cas4 family n=2 Tax=Ktedonobacter racemifer TaxID=363277 RepID=D6U711_KTERA|nr:CRISPR-associated exonuclease, Cas4 family [Ktedonobacter racemifer DSM 44963]
MITEEEVAQLRKENQELLQVALLRIEELEHQKTPPPAFVKANVKKPQVEETRG